MWYYPGVSRENVEDVAIQASQARNLIRRAALMPKALQLVLVADALKNTTLACVRLKNAPGGRVLLHPEDAGSPLAAALGSAFERLGCLHKLGIAPEPFDGGKPVPFHRGQQ
jgi:hypothetical protein